MQLKNISLVVVAVVVATAFGQSTWRNKHSPPLGGDRSTAIEASPVPSFGVHRKIGNSRTPTQSASPFGSLYAGQR